MKKKNKMIFLILVISFSLFILVFMRSDSDYFWHIKAGEYMVRNHTILTQDIFSWTIPGTYWMSHEWGFEIIIYLFSLIFGKYHVFVYGLLCLLSLLLIINYINRDKIEKNKLFGIIWLSFSIVLYGLMTARPHMLSNILLLLTAYFSLDLFNNKDSKKIYFLPIIAILWANIHGGSSNLVYIIPMICLIAGLFKFKYSKIEAGRLCKKQIITYLVVIIVSMLCININPHGFKMFIYPYINFLDSMMVSSISEWQPTVLSDTSHWLYFFFVFIILIIFIFSKKKIRLVDGLLFLFCLFLGLKSIRFWGYTYIIMSLIVFDYVSPRKDDKGTNLCILFVSVILVFIFAYSFNKNILVSTNKRALSDKLINTIKDEKPKRLYNNYDLGGELINNDIKVFIDGRADLYAGEVFKDSRDISFLINDYEKVFKKYNFDYLLVSDNYSTYYYLKNNKDYKIIYKEDNYYLYKKKDAK